MHDRVGSRGAISEEKEARDEAREGCKSLLAALCFHHPELAPAGLQSALGMLPTSRAEPQEPMATACPWPRPNMCGFHPVTIAQKASAIHFGVRRCDLLSHSRKMRLALARQVAWYVVKANAPYVSLPDIARRSGGRDHTSVLYGIECIPGKIAKGRLMEADIEAVNELYWRMKDGR